MKNFFKKCCDKLKMIFIKILCNIEHILLAAIDKLGNIFEIFETVLEMALFWIALFPLSYRDIRDRHIVREGIQRVIIGNSDDELKIAQIVIDKIQDEYNKRQDSSSEKMKILFQTLSFVFAINAAILTYILKELKQNIDIFFVLSLSCLTISLFMTIIYYKVSSVNRLTFPEDSQHYSMSEYLYDVLYCIEFNNKRLDFFVTVYKSALRYFTISAIFLVLAIAKQFHMHINLPTM